MPVPESTSPRRPLPSMLSRFLSCSGYPQEKAAFIELVRFLPPIIGGSFLNIFADRFTLAFVGHWDYKDVSHYDGASIGKMYSNITGLSLGVSATIGLATFCSQAHGAGRSCELNPIYLRRALLLLSGCFLFALFAAVLCEPMLITLGQPPSVAKTSARFTQVQLIGLPFYWSAGAINTVCSSTKYRMPGMVMNTTSSIVQLLLCLAFTHPNLLNWGYLGVGLGRALGGFVSLISVVLHVRCADLQPLVWRRVAGAEAVTKPGAFPAYLKVSVPAALVVWSEWWAFEVTSLLVGLTPRAELNLAAHGTLFNIIVVVYMVWASACTAVCALVGNLLGEGRNDKVPPMLRAAFAFSASTSLFVVFAFEVCKGWVAAFFTDDTRVQAIFQDNSLGLVLSVPLYAQLMTFYGALRGANYQRPGILGTFVGYWVIGLPFGALCGCVWHWPTPLLGVWLGNALALAIASAWVLTAVFIHIDWLTVRRVEEEVRESPLLQTGCQSTLTESTESLQDMSTQLGSDTSDTCSQEAG